MTEGGLSCSIGGQGTLSTSGVFFFPNCNFTYSGQANTNIPLAAQFIGRTITTVRSRRARAPARSQALDRRRPQRALSNSSAERSDNTPFTSSLGSSTMPADPGDDRRRAGAVRSRTAPSDEARQGCACVVVCSASSCCDPSSEVKTAAMICSYALPNVRMRVRAERMPARVRVLPSLESDRGSCSARSMRKRISQGVWARTLNAAPSGGTYRRYGRRTRRGRC
jgi:hypothetical protein